MSSRKVRDIQTQYPSTFSTLTPKTKGRLNKMEEFIAQANTPVDPISAQGLITDMKFEVGMTLPIDMALGNTQTGGVAGGKRKPKDSPSQAGVGSQTAASLNFGRMVREAAGEASGSSQPPNRGGDKGSPEPEGITEVVLPIIEMTCEACQPAIDELKQRIVSLEGIVQDLREYQLAHMSQVDLFGQKMNKFRADLESMQDALKCAKLTSISGCTGSERESAIQSSINEVVLAAASQGMVCSPTKAPGSVKSTENIKWD